MKKLKIILQCDFFYWILVFFSIFYTFLSLSCLNKHSILETTDTKFELIVNNFKIDGNKLSLELKGKEHLVATYYFKTEQELNDIKKQLKFGSKLIVSGNLLEANSNTIFNLFNYKKYLYNKDIFYILEIDSIDKIIDTSNLFYKFKNKIVNRIESFEYKQYFYAFIIGETYLISNDIYSSYKINGVTHLFALSGMHVNVFVFVLYLFLKKLKIKESLKYILIFLFLSFICFLSCFSPSIIRATFFLLLLRFNKLLEINTKTLNILLFIFSLYLFYNPYIIFDLSFELSFIVSYFIIGYMSLFKKITKIKQLFLVSFVSFLASLPILINNFFSVNLLSMINNMIFVPYVTLIVFPLTLLTFVFPFLIDIYIVSLNIMENMSTMLVNKSILYTSIKFNFYLLTLYYLLLYSFSKSNKKIYIFLLILILIINYNLPKLDKNTYISFIDVGQGDSTLIITPFKKHVILIDTGGKVEYLKKDFMKRNNEYKISDNLISYFHSLGIRKIDFLILTHGDYDHMGEAINLVNHFKIEEVIFNVGSYNELEKRLIKKLKYKSIAYKKEVKEIKIDKYKLKFLNTKTYNNENDNSNVVYIKLNETKLLLMGDAGVEREKDILNKYKLKNIDLLKVGHHGSKTSSGKEFIDEITPKYSIISVGKNNRYGHPNKEVLENLSNSKIYRTDLDGSIEIRLNKNEYKIRTCGP